jgi:GTP:adenosylcobinamide-phosphate guanylyltransferase
VEDKVYGLLLAGTKGCKKLNIGNIEEDKPYIEIGGKTLVRRGIEAWPEREDIGQLYAVIDPTKPLKSRNGNGDNGNGSAEDAEKGNGSAKTVEYVPVEQQATLVDNIKLASYRHILVSANFPSFYTRSREEYLKQNPGAAEVRVLMYNADSPFIRPEDITRFIDTADPDADLVIGMAEAGSLSKLENEIGQELFTPETKTALFPFEGTMVRNNNLVMLKPMKIPEEAWTMVQRIYDNRFLLNERGGNNLLKWFSIARHVGGYAFKKGPERKTRSKAYFRGLFHAMGAALARWDDNVIFRMMYCRDDFEKVVHDISGGKVTGSLNICDIAHPALDVDNQAMLDMLLENDAELFHKLIESKRRYGRQSLDAVVDAPPCNGEELSKLNKFVLANDNLFSLDEEIEPEDYGQPLTHLVRPRQSL